MSENKEIQYFNRETNQIEIEKVYGDAFVKFLYDSAAGKFFTPIFANKIVSKAYGALQSTMMTQLKVPKFVKNFNIDLTEYKPGSVLVDKKELSYKNFNEFFIREFEAGKRNIVQDENLMPAFCEARYFGYDKIDESVVVPVKGKFLKATDLIGEPDIAKPFIGGPLLIARLCPVDYHRYHYPDNGKTIDSFQVPGEYHSVNPIALKLKQDIFIENERRVSILETKNFGKIAYIEVGAAMVGKIVQTHNESKSFRRGQEKGYFLFGGSTVIIIGQQGAWSPSTDIIDNTNNGIETYIKLGDTVGVK